MADTDTNLTGMAVAGGAIANALLDTLVKKGVITGVEARDTVKAAELAVVPLRNLPGGYEALQVLSALIVRLSKNHA